MDKELRNLLIEFYIDQYREYAKRANTRNIKTSHYMHRLNTKARSISKAVYRQTERGALNYLHQDVKRLAVLAYYVGTKPGKGRAEQRDNSSSGEGGFYAYG